MSYKPLYTTKVIRQQQNEQWLKRNKFRPKQMWNQLSWFRKKSVKRNKQEKPQNKAKVSSGISQHDAEYSGSNPFQNSSFEFEN